MDQPLGSSEGWASEPLVREACEPIEGLDTAYAGGFAARVADAKVVVLGGAALGASEPFRWRARLTRELLSHHGFTVLATTADWADASSIDRQLRALPRPSPPRRAFDGPSRWPWHTWEVLDFLEWLRAHDAETRSPAHRAGFFGLDVLGEDAALDSLGAALDAVDPQVGLQLRQHWGRARPDEAPRDERARAALREVEPAWLQRLEGLLSARLEAGRQEGERYRDALDAAAVRAALGPWARAVVSEPVTAWSLRALHLADTLQALLSAGGSRARAVVWADDALCGDSAATSAWATGARSLGHVLRQRLGARVALVGFGAGRGGVLAAPAWGAAPTRASLGGPRVERPASFMLPLRGAARALRQALAAPRAQAWCGAVGPPCAVEGSLAGQFDEVAWFDEVTPLAPLGEREASAWPFAPPPPPLPELHPPRHARGRR